MPQISTKPRVCDYCINEAYDFGFQTLELQEQVMIDMGEDMPDHFCDVVEVEGDLDYLANNTCACACKPKRKQRQSANKR